MIIMERKMKKAASLLTVCILGFGLTGCGGSDSEKGAAKEDSKTSAAGQAEIDKMMGADGRSKQFGDKADKAPEAK